jgi:hypothetical protein
MEEAKILELEAKLEQFRQPLLPNEIDWKIAANGKTEHLSN